MAIVVNNPAEADRSGGMGFFLGVLLLVVVVFLFFIYGLPVLNQAARNNAGSSDRTQINVPGRINVDVQNPQQ